MVSSVVTLYDRLGLALRYPSAATPAYFDLARAALAEADSAATRELDGFIEETRGLSGDALEELYTTTFDLNPVAALEVGWHLYGEAYERGRFLVQMRELLHEVDMHGGSELPDHLTVMLPLLARIDVNEADGLTRTAVRPAIEKMLVPLRESNNPYRHLLEAIRLVLERASSEEISAPRRGSVPY
jgi:nitrate reductase molybdenum cofactor assembly chaperone